MDRTPQEKFLLLFEAAKRSLLSAELLLQRIADELDEVTRDIDSGITVEDRACLPLISCVSFVDFSFRFHSLVQALPMIKSTRPELLRLNSALSSVETARHHLQHLRGDLSSNASIEYPLWGSLSWVRHDNVYSMCLSTPVQTYNFASLSYDRHEHVWTAKHVYSLHEVTIDLDSVLGEMKRAYLWIASAVQSPNASIAELKWGGTFACKMSLKNVPESPLT
jgi:hypothetical protein